MRWDLAMSLFCFIVIIKAGAKLGVLAQKQKVI